jgi:hypothetical protein
MDGLADVLDNLHLSDGSAASDGVQEDGVPAGPPFSCALCGLHGLTSASQLAEHLAGRRHARAAAGGLGASGLTCELCGVRATSRRDLDNHTKGKRHRAKLGEFAARAEEALTNLDTLNRWLVKLALPEETSTTAARAALKRVHINIFDLVSERFEPVFPSVKELRTYTTKNGKIFPKNTSSKTSKSPTSSGNSTPTQANCFRMRRRALPRG